MYLMFIREIVDPSKPLSADQLQAQQLKHEQERLTAKKKAFQLAKARKKAQALTANQHAVAGATP